MTRKEPEETMTDIIADMNLRDLWEDAAAAHPHKTFLVFQYRNGKTCEYSYCAFNEQINRTANLFAELGISKGDCVSVQICNSPEFLLCLFGLVKLGAVMVPLHSKSTLPEFRHAITVCNARLAVIEERLLDEYRQLQKDEGLLPDGIVLVRCHNTESGTAAQASGLPYFDELKDRQPTQLKLAPPLDSMDTAEVIFTSGTTSQPKGVDLTHANLIFSGIYGIWQTSLRDSDRLLTAMPACHSNFQMAALTPVLVAGATLILLEHYSAHSFWQQIRDYRATITQCISMMVRTLLLQPVDTHEKDHQLREILYFMPLTNEEKVAFEQRFAVRLLNSYGSTESIGWVITDPPHGKRRWPSVGRVGLGYEARIVDDKGAELPAHKTGEIQVKGIPGRSIMKGYYNDPEATRLALDEEGWLHTGDKGYCDEDGWFYFVDRRANLIKRSGENISATEIEMVLSAHPAIELAAVIGVPDPLRDEAVKAFIVVKNGASLTVEEVLDYCRERLAAYKLPSFVEFRADLPRTCSMKIEKKKLH
ncbi:MAG: crotonobetaine/carnitine-CoA ligase [Coriobacteriia bacterium]|nr:crotonobetaine/carnitine-CoA ligase [Coriobacteriia bacterium]